MPRERLSLIAFLIAAAAFSRLLPHWPNFTAVAAIALFGGAVIKPKWLAFALPLMALVASDAVLGFYPQMTVTYLAFACIVPIGFLLKESRGALRLGAASILSSLMFFLITNFALWPSYGLYPKTSAGVAESYVMALPFLRNALIGDLFYTFLLFGALALAEKRLPSVRKQAV